MRLSTPVALLLLLGGPIGPATLPAQERPKPARSWTPPEPALAEPWPFQWIAPAETARLSELTLLPEMPQWPELPQWAEPPLAPAAPWPQAFDLLLDREIGDLVAPAMSGIWAAGGRRLSLPEPHRDRLAGPEDSLYRSARAALNRGEYRRAATLFATFAQRYPQSRFLPAALYWQAFCLYRAGNRPDLEKALGLLDAAAKQYPKAAGDPEVSALTTRLIGALAARGDTEAASRLRKGTAGAASCDPEDTEVRAEALSALVQNDPDGALGVLRRTLARRDECSVPLRRRAVYLLGKDGDQSRLDDVLEVVKTDPSPEVRADAIARLAQVPGERSSAILEQLFTGASDESIQRAVVQALRSREDSAAGRLLRRAIEREDLAEPVRIDAIRSLAGGCCSFRTLRIRPGWSFESRVAPALGEADVALLRSVFDRTSSRNVRAAIVETMARAGGPAADGWLVAMIGDSAQDLRFRRAALGRLRRSETPIDELIRLYDRLSERELRATLVDILGGREEPAATDKLLEIARTGTDPVIRRAAIGALSRKNDPRTTKLLLELVEKP